MLPRAIKNPVEIAGHQAAQARDGAAIARFLHWVEDEAPKGELDELKASDRLEALAPRERRSCAICRSTPSPAPGPNGAIVHYRASRSHQPPARAWTRIYLVDSGGQYVDGTTDITRTVAIGEPTAEMRDRFTRVLKGHIAIATALFPKGTRGSQLDSFARRPLWEAGLDYAHGTGHGVGSFLVGPRRAAAHLAGGKRAVGRRRAAAGRHDPFQRARLLQDRANTASASKIWCWSSTSQVEGAEKEMLGFETLTFAPIERRLVDRDMLSATRARLAQRLSRRGAGEDRPAA